MWLLTLLPGWWVHRGFLKCFLVFAKRLVCCWFRQAFKALVVYSTLSPIPFFSQASSLLELREWGHFIYFLDLHTVLQMHVDFLSSRYVSELFKALSLNLIPNILFKFFCQLGVFCLFVFVFLGGSQLVFLPQGAGMSVCLLVIL